MTDFSSEFWTVIRQQFRMPTILNKAPLKKKKLFELDPFEINIDKDTISKWSSENIDLLKEIEMNGYAEYICNKEYISNFYKNLDFQRRKILDMDDDLKKFTFLEVLKLSFNEIKELKNVPPNLKELEMYFNGLQSIKGQMHLNLKYLALGWNKINENGLEKLCQYFPNLISLDFSHNLLTNLEDTIGSLVKLKALKSLHLKRNPIELLISYKPTIISELIQLTYFDGINPLEIEKKLKSSQMISDLNQKDEIIRTPRRFPSTIISHSMPSDIEVIATEKVKATLYFENLESINDGINLDDFLDDENRQSYYWIEYSFDKDKPFSKVEKLYPYSSACLEEGNIRIFLNETIKIDFDVDMKIIENLEKGLFIRVNVKEPIMIKKEENGEIQPKLDDGKILFQERVLGVVRIALSQIFDERFVKGLFYLLPENALKSKELFYPLDKESDRIEIKLKEISDLKNNQNLENEPKKIVGKEKKKDDKKNSKKGGKFENKTENDHFKASEYPINSRRGIALENEILISNFVLISVKFEI